MSNMSIQEVENKRRQLLQALEALPAVGVGLDKPVLRRVESLPDTEWTEEEWDFANARNLLNDQQKARYSVMVLDRQQRAERESLLAQYQGGNIPGLGVATRGSVSTHDLQAGQPPGAQGVRETSGPEQPPAEEVDEPYENWKAKELQDEVAARNEQRDPEHQLRPASTKKEDLVRALYDDDEANQPQQS